MLSLIAAGEKVCAMPPIVYGWISAGPTITRKRRNYLLRKEGVSTLVDWRVPLSDLDFGSEEMAAVQRVILSKWLSMGAEVQAFEKEFAAMQGARHALAVANASAGLHLAFLALSSAPVTKSSSQP